MYKLSILFLFIFINTSAFSSTDKPYTINNKTYIPLPTYSIYNKTGIASWYGKDFHGKKTATGEIYNMHDITAAHPTLPLPSYAKVTNLKTGDFIVVKVNDRGPFKDNRIIDLSYGAAKAINTTQPGLAEVEVVRIDDNEAKKIIYEQQTKGKTIQLGAFLQQENAVFLKTLLTKNNNDENIETNLKIKEIGGLFKLQLGPIYNKNDLQNTLNKVKELAPQAFTL